jgi:hypothetical protein
MGHVGTNGYTFKDAKIVGSLLRHTPVIKHSRDAWRVFCVGELFGFTIEDARRTLVRR